MRAPAATVFPVEQPVPASALDTEPSPDGWAEEEAASAPPRSSFGPLGLVAGAVLLMVAVYLGATLLMKH